MKILTVCSSFLLLLNSQLSIAETKTCAEHSPILVTHLDATNTEVWQFDFNFLPAIRKNANDNLRNCYDASLAKPSIARNTKYCSNDFNQEVSMELKTNIKRGKFELAQNCIDALANSLLWEQNNQKDPTINERLERERVLLITTFQSLKSDLPVKTEAEKVAEAIEKEQLAKIHTHDTWYPGLYFGTRMMPEYDEAGNNEGFRESNITGRFQLDARADYTKSPNLVKKVVDTLLPENMDKSKIWSAHNVGVELEMFSEGVVNCEQLAANDPDIDQATCERGNIPTNELEFNDVANTISASAYIWLSAWKSASGDVEIGPGYRIGIQSREKLTDTGDSINRFRGFGARWVFNDFLTRNKQDSTRLYQNGIPKFELQYYRRYYEDFLGLDKEQKRHYVRANFRPTELPILMGLTVNGGEGPDEVSLTLEYGVRVDSLINVF